MNLQTAIEAKFPHELDEQATTALADMAQVYSGAKKIRTLGILVAVDPPSDECTFACTADVDDQQEMDRLALEGARKVLVGAGHDPTSVTLRVVRAN